MYHEINALQKNEVDKFEAVYLKALENNWPTLEGPTSSNREDWERNFRYWINNNFTILILKIDNKIQGYIAGDPSRILHLWVHKDYRGNNYGEYLIKEFLSFQAEKGFEDFTLKAYAENIKYFKTLGYETSSENEKFSIFKL